MNAPMGRVTRLAVMVSATAGIERPNSFEIADTAMVLALELLQAEARST